MGSSKQLKSDILHLALLMGLCSAIGVYLILTTVLITKDGAFYIEQAKQIAQDPVGVCRRYPPGYPFLLWTSHTVASWFVEEDSPMLWAYSAQTVTLLCRVLALIPLYLLGRLLVGAVNSFWALFVLVILPYPAFYGSDVLREWPYLLFLSTGLLLLYWGLATKRWRALVPVGLIAGLGYLIRPECAQLIVYAVLGLLVVRESSAIERDASSVPGPPLHLTRRFGAGLLMIAGFVVPVVPYVHASGRLVPHQLRPSISNLPPVLSAIGSKPAADDPLEFEIRVGERLELPIRAADPDGDSLAFSLASVPMGSRPAYAFRSTAVGGEFWTLSEREKEQLVTVYGEAWDCEGIAWYAYARPDARSGLQPVYRFWSPTRQRHFFTISESEKEALVAESTGDSWIYEGPVFYAFAEGDHPADAATVYRFWDEGRGYSWATTLPAGTEAQKETIAWYAYSAGEPPAGAGIENGVFRWRPDRGQEGEHLLNIIVADGELPCSQLMVVRVIDAGSAGPRQQGNGLRQACIGAGIALSVQMGLPDSDARVLLRIVQDTIFRNLVRAVDEVLDGLGEDFMIIPVLPWILGLCYGLRGRAKSLERVLILAVLVVNIGLMLSRNIWIAPGSARRYCIPMIALTIFYLPAGLDVMTRVLNRIYTFRGRLAGFGDERRPPWFYLLLVGGVVLCTPKLIFTPLRADKAGYRAAGEWLRHNAAVGAVVAEPDRRISFYAERSALLYELYPNWRRADYVVKIAGRDRMQTPEGWMQMYSVAVGPEDDRELIVYGRTIAGEDSTTGIR